MTRLAGFGHRIGVDVRADPFRSVPRRSCWCSVRHVATRASRAP